WRQLIRGIIFLKDLQRDLLEAPEMLRGDSTGEEVPGIVAGDETPARPDAHQRRIRGCSPSLGDLPDGMVRLTRKRLERGVIGFGASAPASAQKQGRERWGLGCLTPLRVIRLRKAAEQALQYGEASARLAGAPPCLFLLEPRRDERLLEVIAVSTR